MIVRPATVADAAGIARVHVRAWQEAYAHLVPGEALAALDPADRVARWESTIASPSNDVFVALEADAVVGWASAVEDSGVLELR